VTDYLLDTNIIGDVTKPAPSQDLLDWFGAQDDRRLFISSLTVAELWRGVISMPSGRKRKALEAWFAGPEGPSRLFSGRILAFETKAAIIWAELMAAGDRKGRPRSAIDMMIAAVAQANNCLVVTGNAKDFDGIEVFNPFRGS
jgi:toxin FitB